MFTLSPGSGIFGNYVAELLSAKDYYPFGSPINGRQFSVGSYPYGFNGKEKDDEAKGNGNSLDYGDRIYDPRLGRFLSIDPLFKEYPDISPYTNVINSPIMFIDHDGRHIRDANGNIVYTKQNVAPLVEVYERGLVKLIIISEKVWIYANDGTKHDAYITKVQTSDGKDVTDLSSRLTYDCHGLTQTEGKFTIDSGDPIEGLLKGDRNGKLTENSSIDEAKAGDILIIRDEKNVIIHTAIVNDDENCSYDSKNGCYRKEEKTESLENLSNMYNKDGKSKLSTTTPVQNKELKTLSKKGENGKAEYTEAEVKKAITTETEK